MVFNTIVSGIVGTKAVINHNGSTGDNIKIYYTVNGQTQQLILDYTIDAGKLTQFLFTLTEMTQS